MQITLHDVTVDLDGELVLHDVSLTLPPGAATVVVGRSGAGQTTLLKVAAGLLRPQRGQVLYDGVDIASLDQDAFLQLQTRTGFVFQDAALWANTSLLGNLELPLQAKEPRLDGSECRRRIDSVLNRYGFAADLSQRPARLSLGQQKIVSFLRAVVPGPEVLFLDEPTSGLDRHWRDVLLGAVADLKSQGTTLAIVAHDDELITGLADRLVVLETGRVLATGPRAEILDDPRPDLRAILSDRLASGQSTTAEPPR